MRLNSERETDLLHVSEDIHATTEKFLALLTIQLVDECCRVVWICILIPATFQHIHLQSIIMVRSMHNSRGSQTREYPLAVLQVNISLK